MTGNRGRDMRSNQVAEPMTGNEQPSWMNGASMPLSFAICPLPSNRQPGFALVSAIFLVVVLAALGGFMLTFSNAQHMGATLDLQGAKAYQAARAGIDWGAYQILQGGNPSCAGAPSLGGALSTFNLTVACTAFGPYTEGANTFHLYQITATAHSGTLGSTTDVERQIQATMAN